jgi:pimeloyl-ACP methyl ester carboxylesterase
MTTTDELALPWLPPGRTVRVPGGEVFARIHRHPDPTRPTLLLLHGWTASADLQFFTAYETLAGWCSFIAVDHRGHGRGLRTARPFELDDAADDAAAVVRAVTPELGASQVITVGYSMGGPVSLLLARRHPELVAGLVVQATALEWRATRAERVRWKTVRLIGPVLRSWAYPRWLRFGLAKLLGPHHELQRFVPWLEAETRRSDPLAIVHAGRSLSRYDARPWASSLGVPAAAVITTHDHLVLPRKQRDLAAALGARVFELHGDHLAAWERPVPFANATLLAVQHVANEVSER